MKRILYLFACVICVVPMPLVAILEMLSGGYFSCDKWADFWGVKGNDPEMF